MGEMMKSPRMHYYILCVKFLFIKFREGFSASSNLLSSENAVQLKVEHALSCRKHISNAFVRGFVKFKGSCAGAALARRDRESSAKSKSDENSSYLDLYWQLVC